MVAAPYSKAVQAPPKEQTALNTAHPYSRLIKVIKKNIVPEHIFKSLRVPLDLHSAIAPFQKREPTCRTSP